MLENKEWKTRAIKVKKNLLQMQNLSIYFLLSINTIVFLFLFFIRGKIGIKQLDSTFGSVEEFFRF